MEKNFYKKIICFMMSMFVSYSTVKGASLKITPEEIMKSSLIVGSVEIRKDKEGSYICGKKGGDGGLLIILPLKIENSNRLMLKPYLRIRNPFGDREDWLCLDVSFDGTKFVKPIGVKGKRYKKQPIIECKEEIKINCSGKKKLFVRFTSGGWFYPDFIQIRGLEIKGKGKFYIDKTTTPQNILNLVGKNRKFKKLEFGKKFYATYHGWGNWRYLDFCFEELGIDYISPFGSGRKGDFNEENCKYWENILSYVKAKKYPVMLPQFRGAPSWTGMCPALFKYLYKKYPEVIAGIFMTSEGWVGRRHFIQEDKIFVPSSDERCGVTKTVSIKEAGLKHQIINTYSGLTEAMKLTLGKSIYKVYKIAPKLPIIISEMWSLPEITELLDQPYAKNLIPAKKSFGSTDIRMYKDLALEGKICGWGAQLSSDGSPYPHFTPEYMERMLKRVIAEGASIWELQDYYYIRGCIDTSIPWQPKLTPWGKALKRAIEYGHAYNNNEITPIEWTPDSYIALLRYPNNTPSNSCVYQQLLMCEANRIFRGWGLPVHADDPFVMNATRIGSWGKDPWRLWYSPAYDIEDFKYFDYKRFYYTTCLTKKTKVGIFVGPGNMNEYMGNRIIEFCKKGGYIIQACGAYIHDPETGKEMLEFENLQYYRKAPEKYFIFPKREQMRAKLLEEVSGFKYEGAKVSPWYFKCKVIDKSTPLIKFDYETEYRGCGNSYARFFFLTGKLKETAKPVVNIYYMGKEYPLIIFNRIGKGGVYTVLSWSLEGMTADYLAEFVREWFKHLIDKYDGDVLKREKVNIYDYEIYAGRLLDWKGKPYIEILKGQKTGIVKNYLSKPIERIFLINHKGVEEKIYDEEGRIKLSRKIEGIIPLKVKVKLKPKWEVIFEKIK